MQKMREARALPCGIFKDKYGDCSNGGISSRFNEILLLNERGHIKVDLDNPPENLCVYVERELFGEEHDFIRPYAPKDSGNVGYMFGGTIIYTSDSRFQGKHPICLHDRQESYELYDMLSR